MSEPNLILQNMRGSCAKVGNTVHTLFRFTGRPRQRVTANSQSVSAQDVADAIVAMGSTEKS